MAETKTVNLNVETNLGSLKSQLKEAQRDVEKLSEKFGATSVEATNAARKAAQLKDAIGDAKALTDAFNPDAKFNALSNSLSGVASGFAAYQGAIGLVGIESKELEAQLLKVQSAMALSQGLQAIGEARDSFMQLAAVVKTSVVNAFSSLKSALISTGIGALVIGIGVLISNFDKLKNSISSNLANAQKFVDSTKKQGDAARATASDFAEYERTLKRLGYTEDQIYKKRGDKLKGAISGTEKEIEANKKLYKEQLANLETAYKFDKLGLNATGRALYGSEEDAQKTRENITNLRKELVKLKNDQYEYDQQQKKSKEQDDKTTDTVEKNTKRKVKAKKEEYDNNEELKSNELEFEEYWNKKLQEIEDAEALRKQKIKDQEAADTEMLSAFKIEQWEFEAKRQKEIDDKAAADKKQLRKQEVQFTQDAFRLIGDFTELMGKRTEKERRKAFKIKKAADLANASIDGVKAVLSTYADTPGGPIIKGVAAGIAGAFSAIQIAKISQQQYSETATNPPSDNTNVSNSGGGGGNVITPNFNIVGNNGTNQLKQLQQAPIQAYVVSGEMSTQQSLDRNRLRNATL